MKFKKLKLVKFNQDFKILRNKTNLKVLMIQIIFTK